MYIIYSSLKHKFVSEKEQVWKECFVGLGQAVQGFQMSKEGMLQFGGRRTYLTQEGFEHVGVSVSHEKGRAL